MDWATAPSGAVYVARARESSSRLVARHLVAELNRRLARIARRIQQQRVRRHQAHATVVAQERIGRVGRRELLRLLEELERVLERRDRAVRLAALQVRLRGALPRDAAVVDALVLRRELLEDLDGLLEEPDPRAGEAVGDREPEDLQRVLVARVHVEHIATDALRFLRLIQVAVLPRLRERGLEVLRREPLEPILRHVPLHYRACSSTRSSRSSSRRASPPSSSRARAAAWPASSSCRRRPCAGATGPDRSCRPRCAP